MSEKIYETTRGEFLRLLGSNYATIQGDHWGGSDEGLHPNPLPDRRLRIVAKQVVLEDGTIIRLSAG